MSILTDVNKAQNFLNNNTVVDPNQQNTGFSVPATFQADGNGLPYTKVPNNHAGQIKRNIITWFVPEFGIVRMYINPNNIVYTDKKAIARDRTKGGYVLQYWGEELGSLDISGTTGSSGVEGINMLYEIYRAEQYAFDGTGLMLAANNATADLANNVVTGVGSMLGGAIGGVFGSSSVGSAIGSSALQGILGMDSPNNRLSPQNISSLAQLAFSVEMYYDGWVFRGFFEDMRVTESAENFLWQYNMKFTVTQKRGYRTNYLPFQRSANQGPSDYGTPYSFDGNNIQK